MNPFRHHATRYATLGLALLAVGRLANADKKAPQGPPESPAETPAKDPAPSKEAGLFQNTAAATPNAPAEPADMKPIFNGKNLDGWEGDLRLWRVENGILIGETTAENPAKGNTFLIWKAGETKDFELRLTFKINGGNSGVQYRSKRFEDGKNPENKWVVGGYQAEIANLAGKDGFIYHERGPGRGYPEKKNYLCNVGDKVVIDSTGKSESVGSVGTKSAIAASYKKGDWNDYVIVAEGNHLRQYINGVQTVDLTDNDEKNQMMAGILALQIHAGPPMKVEFKNLRLLLR